ncbi:MAG: formate--phosphoribosylaminoimidazolecarboxamide ligase [Thermoproteota archaeon]|nr:formate--phosphoribosylaminoimidazolecarboxamide ligase [Thermoproteota archaeon]
MKKRIPRNPKICTIGSHCSLQVLKGAKDEGFSTYLICEKKRYNIYKRFAFIDHILFVDKFENILEKPYQDRLYDLNCIIIPHGTLIANLNSDQIEGIHVPIFGNRFILRWEADRILKEKLMRSAGLNVPGALRSKNEIDRLCIVKLRGAAGGRGYFMVWDTQSFNEGCQRLVRSGVIKGEEDLYIQEYVQGVPVFLHYFYSPLSNEVEFMGVDRRYESDIDGISRIPSRQQLNVTIEPTYNVIGNIPLVLRESLLEEVYNMGENFVRAAQNLVPPGIPGPFCLEGVYTKEGKFITFEFSARIVAGTNLYITGSPYTDLLFEREMSTGRRIALEIKRSVSSKQLDRVLT